MTSLLCRKHLVPASAVTNARVQTQVVCSATNTIPVGGTGCSCSGPVVPPRLCRLARRRQVSQVCRSGAQVPVKSVDTLSEVGQNTFWPAVRGAGDKLVVAYFFGDKCVQCKAMYPQLVDMAQELAPQQVLFVKFNCKKENKDLGVELGIKRSPTFQLYHKGKKLGEMIGAKPDELRMLIENTKERAA